MRKNASTLLSNRVSGFTLVELMIIIVVVAVLASLAVPNMRTFILNNRLTGASTEMLRTIQTARSEASKRQQNVVICTSADVATSPTNPTCGTTNITGWIVFQDTNNSWTMDTGDFLIETHTFDSSAMYVRANNDMILSFAATGFANLPGAKTPSTAFVMCDSRGNASVGGQSTARGIGISNTGRARLTRAVSDTVFSTVACP